MRAAPVDGCVLVVSVVEVRSLARLNLSQRGALVGLSFDVEAAGLVNEREEPMGDGTETAGVDWGAAARVAAQCEQAARELRDPANLDDELEASNMGYVAAALDDVDRALHNAAVSARAFLGDRDAAAVTGEEWAGAKAQALGGEGS